MRAWTCHSVPFCEGWRPVDHGTPTHAEWPMRLFSCFLGCAIPRGLASRCSRDANPRGMSNAISSLFFVLWHSAWVGVPLFTFNISAAREIQNGSAFFERLRSRPFFFAFERLRSRPCLLFFRWLVPLLLVQLLVDPINLVRQWVHIGYPLVFGLCRWRCRSRL